MVQHIGIVGCSAEGAALCYRTICAEAPEIMGEHRHPELTLHTHPLADYMLPIRVDNWSRVAELMASSAKVLAGAGADFLICPDNTVHQAFGEAARRSSLPWLHIAEVVANEAAAEGYKRLGITGTKYLMTGPVYPSMLREHNIGCEIPVAADRERMDELIFTELVYGRTRESARQYLNEVIAELAERGCDAVVLGCTEIPLLVDPQDCPLPILDSTRLLARAALKRALGPST